MSRKNIELKQIWWGEREYDLELAGQTGLMPHTSLGTLPYGVPPAVHQLWDKWCEVFNVHLHDTTKFDLFDWTRRFTSVADVFAWLCKYQDDFQVRIAYLLKLCHVSNKQKNNPQYLAEYLRAACKGNAPLTEEEGKSIFKLLLFVLMELADMVVLILLLFLFSFFFVLIFSFFPPAGMVPYPQDN